MKYLPYVLKHLRRNWIRTTSTVLAMAICIFLICTLRTFIEAVNYNLKSANASRLVTRNAVSLVFNLPVAYKQRIENVPGVKSVFALNWFGGSQHDARNFFPNLAVEAEPFLGMYPEYILPEDQKQAWLQDMRGCIIGRKLADRFGWKIGSVFQLESFIPPYRIGRPFEFVVRGIFETDETRFPGTDTSAMYFHWKYLHESTNRRTAVGTYTILVDDPNRAGEVSKKIDALFENSDSQTRTETEAAFRASFISLAGNLALLLNGIGTAVAFTILLVTANTMSMAVRERRSEIAVLKTLGFSSGLVMMLILAEALTLGILGGGLGIALSGGLLAILPKLPGIGALVSGFSQLVFSPQVAVLGFAVALLLGLAAGFVPAFLAYRARITEMLRQV